MKVLSRGAEAVVYSDVLDGQEVVVKERVRKRYRLKQIDERLRRERTRQEMKLMREARGHGVLTPRIVSSDEASCKIVMERIDGVLMKDFLSKTVPASRLAEAGREIGRMHAAGIVHGDLTTSNMMVSGGKVFFLDFGLGQFSKRTEDMATDLSVLLETLRATHHRVQERCWRAILKGYREGNPKSGQVLSRLEELESRARYKRKTD